MTEFRFSQPVLPALKEVVLTTPDRPVLLLPDPEQLDMLSVPVGNRSFLFGDVHDSSIEGKLFFNDNVAKSATKGLVIMVHGAPPRPTRYTVCFDLLGALLAAGGFIAVSIKHHISGVLAASDQVVKATRHVMNRFQTQFNLTGKPLALVGHSEGGAGVILAGERIPKEVGEHFSSVRAIVALAPTPPGTVKGSCQALLVLEGTHDADSPWGGASLRAFHDAIVPSKYFGWMHGCNHSNHLKAQIVTDNNDGNAYVVFNAFSDEQSRVIREAQNVASANYAAMFLLWQLSNGGKYRPVFSGEETVKWKQSELSETAMNALVQRFKFFPRKSDESDAMPLGIFPKDSKFSGFYEFDFSAVDPKIGPDYAPLNLLYYTMRFEKAACFLVRWDKNKKPSPIISITCSNPELTEISASAIEFDAIQVAENKTTPPRLKVRLAIVHHYGTTQWVDVFIEPSLWLYATPFTITPGVDTISSSMLCTVRVPLSRFALIIPAHKKSMQMLIISFEPSATSGLIAITGFRASKY